MVEGRDQPATFRWPDYLGSTGVKMFLILTLALLPLGLIALIASLQAIRSADLEKEALLRVAVTQSARKLSADIQADRTALQIAVNAMATRSADRDLCSRLNLFLTAGGDEGSQYYIYDRSGRRLCGSAESEPAGLAAAERFGAASVLLLPASQTVVSMTRSGDGRFVALTYYSRAHIESVADPATAIQNRQLTLRQGDRRLEVSSSGRRRASHGVSLSARLDPPDILLTMTVGEPPATIARLLSLFLPLVMWFAAAAIGWFVVNRLLIRPLVLLRRSVAGYQPGQVLQPLQRVRTPAQEIIALGETFREISEDVATHEAEMAEGLDTQRKLTREVHHRVKNNLQIISSLISLHARSAHEPEAAEAYSTIQRRVDALSVVHRNHFAELEVNRGVGVRALISELAASLRSTAPVAARRFAIQIESDNLNISQDVAVPVAFLVTELVEMAMMLAPQSAIYISVQEKQDAANRALLTMRSQGLRESEAMTAFLSDRYGRVLTGLSRQLREPLDYDPDLGAYAITITTLP